MPETKINYSFYLFYCLIEVAFAFQYKLCYLRCVEIEGSETF